MPADDDSGAPALRNPATVTDLEPDTVDVRPDYAANGVRLEVVDRDGRGFNTILDLDDALGVAMKIIGAIARLRGWEGRP
jgi:hypothetical protein